MIFDTRLKSAGAIGWSLSACARRPALYSAGPANSFTCALLTPRQARSTRNRPAATLFDIGERRATRIVISAACCAHPRESSTSYTGHFAASARPPAGLAGSAACLFFLLIVLR